MITAGQKSRKAEPFEPHLEHSEERIVLPSLPFDGIHCSPINGPGVGKYAISCPSAHQPRWWTGFCRSH